MRIWNRVTGEPWAITEPALHTILEIAARENETPESVAAKLGRELRNTHTVVERDGVAIIPVVGPLFRYANIFTQISGASSYEILAKDFTAALDDPAIKAIILDIDSPGGEVNGVAELAGMVFEARGRKPIIAYASGDAASGAYWLASAADQIVVSETSALGSIGVVGVYRSKDAGESASEIEIVSSQSPHKRLDPASSEGKKRLQQRIDAMANVFITTISRNRGVDPTTVMDNFGGGDVMIGAAAVGAGLADRVGSLERLISELSGSSNPPVSEGFLTKTSPTKEKTSMDIETLVQEHPDLVTQIRREATMAERERIKGIVSCAEAQKREGLAQEIAFGTELSAIEAQHLLGTSPMAQEQPSTSFERVMASVPNPDVTPAGQDDVDDVEAFAKRVAAAS